MFDEDIAYRVWIILHSVDLLVDCPTQRLTKLCGNLADSCHILGTISSVIGKDHTNEVLS
jgi:hypothetical protein